MKKTMKHIALGMAATAMMVGSTVVSMAGTLERSAYDNDKNKQAVQAYIDAMEHRAEFTGYNKVEGVYVTDVDQDGVVEFVVNRAEEQDETKPGRYMTHWTTLLSYGDALSMEDIESAGVFDDYANVGVIPDEKKLVTIAGYNPNALYMREHTFENAKTKNDLPYEYWYSPSDASQRADNAKSKDEYEKTVLLRKSMLENLASVKAHMGDGSAQDPLYPMSGNETGAALIMENMMY